MTYGDVFIPNLCPLLEQNRADSCKNTQSHKLCGIIDIIFLPLETEGHSPEEVVVMSGSFTGEEEVYMPWEQFLRHFGSDHFTMYSEFTETSTRVLVLASEGKKFSIMSAVSKGRHSKGPRSLMGCYLMCWEDFFPEGRRDPGTNMQTSHCRPVMHSERSH